MRTRLSVFACVVLAAAVAASAGWAASGAATFALLPEHYDPSLKATRSYFIAVERPGQTYINSIRIRNLGKQTGTALLYAVDATTGQTSGAVYLDSSKPRSGVGAWATLGASSVTLGPGQSRVIPVTVHVPAGARPGDHLGGIVAENEALTSSNGKGALRIKIRHLTIAAILVQVPGKAQAKMEIAGVRAGGEHGYQYVYLHLKNAGTVGTKPTGSLLISDASGKQIASRDLKLDTFLPGTSIDYPVLLPERALSPGGYTAAVELTYSAAALGYRRSPGASLHVTRSFSFTVTAAQHAQVFTGVPPLRPATARAAAHGTSPLLWIAAGLAALFLILTAAVLVLRRRP
jgi:Bacterial protein of unknown function (DUF916)